MWRLKSTNISKILWCNWFKILCWCSSHKICSLIWFTLLSTQPASNLGSTENILDQKLKEKTVRLHYIHTWRLLFLDLLDLLSCSVESLRLFWRCVFRLCEGVGLPVAMHSYTYKDLLSWSWKSKKKKEIQVFQANNGPGKVMRQSLKLWKLRCNFFTKCQWTQFGLEMMTFKAINNFS